MQINPRVSTPASLGQTEPLDRLWISMAGSGVGFVRRDWQAALAQSGLRTVDDFLSVVGEPLLKPGLRKRYRARLTVQRDGESQVAYLKRYESKSILRQLTDWFVHPCADRDQLLPSVRSQSTSHLALFAPAHRDAQVAAALRAGGISTPETLAWGWKKGPGQKQQSFVLSKAVPGEAVDQALSRPFFLSRRGEAFRKQQELIRELGLLARQFHELGWCHRDFYLCHIFVDQPELQPRFSIIDLQRVFRPRWRIWRWRIKDLAQLNYSAKPEMFSRTMRLRFAKAYFGQNQFSGFEKRILRRIQRKTESMARRDRSPRS